MERNRATVNPKSWKAVLPAYWLERDLSGAPGKWNNFLFTGVQSHAEDYYSRGFN